MTSDDRFVTATNLHLDIKDAKLMAAEPAPPGPWLATPSEPTVEADLAELAALRAKVARVEALVPSLASWRTPDLMWAAGQIRNALAG